jgi:hypothetical protein
MDGYAHFSRKLPSVPYNFAFVSQLSIYGIQQLLGNKIVPAREKQGKEMMEKKSLLKYVKRDSSSAL